MANGIFPDEPTDGGRGQLGFNLLRLSTDESDGSVSIYVDGRNFIDLVREVEQPFATREGHPDLAGAYAGLPAEHVFAPSRHLLGQASIPYAWTDKVILLECECGEPGCWPLTAKVTVADETVTWSDFEQPHRGPTSRAGRWRYGGLGPFVFSRAQYEAELARGRPSPE